MDSCLKYGPFPNLENYPYVIFVEICGASRAVSEAWPALGRSLQILVYHSLYLCIYTFMLLYYYILILSYGTTVLLYDWCYYQAMSLC